MTESILSSASLFAESTLVRQPQRRPLSIADIRKVLPHAGLMCLLSSVESWDETQIHCTSSSHRMPANPLRGPNGLASVNGVEYAAQAMALHAALVSGALALEQPPASLNSPMSVNSPAHPPHGVLASVRGVSICVPYLDTFAQDLTVLAKLLSGDPQTAMYEFAICAGAQSIISGRASVMFNVKRAF